MCLIHTYRYLRFGSAQSGSITILDALDNQGNRTVDVLYKIECVYKVPTIRLYAHSPTPPAALPFKVLGAKRHSSMYLTICFSNVILRLWRGIAILSGIWLLLMFVRKPTGKDKCYMVFCWSGIRNAFCTSAILITVVRCPISVMSLSTTNRHVAIWNCKFNLRCTLTVSKYNLLYFKSDFSPLWKFQMIKSFGLINIEQWSACPPGRIKQANMKVWWTISVISIFSRGLTRRPIFPVITLNKRLVWFSYKLIF